jgi:hypothetical protein
MLSLPQLYSAPSRREVHHGPSALQRQNSWTKSRQKGYPPCKKSPLKLYIEIYRFLFLQTHATFYSFYSLDIVLYEYTVKERGGKHDRKPYHLPYNGLRNFYRNLQPENSQDYAQKHQRSCAFMNSASG